MSRWWRAYDEAVDDPKLQCLNDGLFRFWFNLCCVCSANKGNLPPLKHIAFRLRMKERKVAYLLDDLRKAGLIDEDDQGIRPHNWHVRQYKSDVSTGRVRRFRQRRGNVSSTVSQTPPETEYRVTEEVRKKDAAPNGATASPPSIEKQLYDRATEVLGKGSGGLTTKLVKAKGGNIPLARAAIEMASTKSSPREFIGAIVRGLEAPQGSPII